MFDLAAQLLTPADTESLRAPQAVDAQPTAELVVAGSAIGEIVAGIGAHVVRSLASEDPVVTRTSVDLVAADTTPQVVRAGVTRELIVTSTTPHRVLAGPRARGHCLAQHGSRRGRDDGIHRIEVWDFDTDTWPDIACQLAGRNMTEDEWAEYGPGTVERRATCPEFPL